MAHPPRLDLVRLELGLSARAFAAALGQAWTSMRRWLAGTHAAPPVVARRAHELLEQHRVRVAVDAERAAIQLLELQAELEALARKRGPGSPAHGEVELLDRAVLALRHAAAARSAPAIARAAALVSAAARRAAPGARRPPPFRPRAPVAVG